MAIGFCWHATYQSGSVHDLYCDPFWESKMKIKAKWIDRWKKRERKKERQTDSPKERNIERERKREEGERRPRSNNHVLSGTRDWGIQRHSIAFNVIALNKSSECLTILHLMQPSLLPFLPQEKNVSCTHPISFNRLSFTMANVIAWLLILIDLIRSDVWRIHCWCRNQRFALQSNFVH